MGALHSTPPNNPSLTASSMKILPYFHFDKEKQQWVVSHVYVCTIMLLTLLNNRMLKKWNLLTFNMARSW